MRTHTTVFGLLGTLALGCMAAPQADDLVLDETELTVPTAVPSIPDGPRAAPTVADPPAPIESPPPPRSVRRRGDHPRFVRTHTAGECSGVSSRGFPAISADGQTVVAPQADHIQLSFNPGSLALQWHDTALGTVERSDPVIVGESPYDDDGECSTAVRRGIHRRVRRRNADLAAQSWRTMEPLPIELFHPDTAFVELHEDQTSIPDRSPQLLIQHNEIIVRIAGVKVLERHPIAAWMRDSVFRAFADRDTGTVLIMSMGCSGDSCTCDPSFETQVLHWQPETFRAIDRHPCEVDPDAADGDQGVCGPQDYGYLGEAAAWSM
ncbi:MAG: hypothetical protein K0V04_27095 [Deltaproteobacteria bacterium]|nr:hypothetical protein [Deltaproteobacteria bacterium]